MVPALVLLLAQLSGSSATARPPECGDSGARSVNVWERAKSPQLRRYCDLVASALSKLSGTPAMARLALDAARRADEVVPGRAAPRILEGRALVSLGEFDDALHAFREGKARDPRALDDPPALLAWARVLSRKGQAEEAADAYRALLPRMASLGAAEQASAEIEAALVAMGRGPSGLDEAVAAAREALRGGQDETAAVAALTLALALDRRGDSAEARALLAERIHGDPRTALETPHAKQLLAASPIEAGALAGLALESTDAAGARDGWESVIAGAHDGVWAGHARAHLAALDGRHARAGRSR